MTLNLSIYWQGNTISSMYSSFISRYRYAEAVGHKVLLQDVKNFICWNFERVCCCTDLGELEPSSMAWFLEQNELVITNELTLFKYVKRVDRH